MSRRAETPEEIAASWAAHDLEVAARARATQRWNDVYWRNMRKGYDQMYCHHLADEAVKRMRLKP